MKKFFFAISPALVLLIIILAVQPNNPGILVEGKGQAIGFEQVFDAKRIYRNSGNQFDENGFHSIESGPDPYIVVVMSDSCGIIPLTPWPTILGRLLKKAYPSRNFRIVNTSTIGYTTEQGRTVLDILLKEYHPDLIISGYGWNDHWKRNETDRDMIQWLSRSFVMRGLFKVRHSEERVFRVPIERYAENLEYIKSEAEKAGVEIIFFETPDGVDADHLWIMRPELQNANILDPGDNIKAIHNLYNESARKVVGSLISISISPENFMSDRVHFTDTGARQFAEQVFQYLESKRELYVL